MKKGPSTLRLIDDVIVDGKTKEEHDQNLHNLMKVAQTEALYLNTDKCAIGQKQVHFFCTIYDKSRIRPDPSKVDEIKKLPSPTNITDQQKILGIIDAFYSTSVRPYCTHEKPLKDRN